MFSGNYKARRIGSFFMAVLLMAFLPQGQASQMLIGGYVQGKGDSVIDFETCMNAGVKYLNFRGWDLDVDTGVLTPEDSVTPFPTFQDRLNDFLNGLAANPGVFANLSLTVGGIDTSISTFLANDKIWPVFIADLKAQVLPYLGQGKFSGIELDFEYPSSGQEILFTNLCLEIKQAMIEVYPNAILTVTTWAPPSQMNMDVEGLYTVAGVDYFEPMMYSYAPDDQLQTDFMNTLDQFIPTMNEFEAAGIPLCQVIPILPLFSIYWENVPSLDTFGLFQNGTIPNPNSTSNDTIIYMRLQNPALLHVLSPDLPSTTPNSWVYVPTDATNGTFYSYLHPYISYCLISSVIELFPNFPITIFAYWHLNADTTTLHDTAEVIKYFNNENTQ